MAHGTTRHVANVRNPVLAHQTCANLTLIAIRAISHLEHRFARAHVLRRIAMTIQAPLHLQRRLLHHQRHSVDPPVTGLASDTFVDVNAVIEIDKIRQIVDPYPPQRPLFAEAGAHRLEIRTRRPNLRVTIDTGLGRRNACRGRHFDRRMAVAAIDADPAHMMLMRELNRLFDKLVRRSHEIRTLKERNQPTKRQHEKKNANEARTRPGISGLGKDLRHTSRAVWQANRKTVLRSSVGSLPADLVKNFSRTTCITDPSPPAPRPTRQTPPTRQCRRARH